MKYKLFSKRGLALIVSLMMCLSAMSTTAWAGNFTQLQGLIDSAEDGNVVLEEDYSYDEEADRDKKSITINKEVDLNLNGKTITGSGDASVIRVNKGGDLTIKDEQSSPATDDGEAAPEKVGTITGGGGSVSWPGAGSNNLDGGGILVLEGKVTMEGGKITGNTAAYGGGVMVRKDGTFELKGGEISNNTATVGGGGVYVREDSTLIVSGGKITGNTANGEREGGGVCIYNNKEGDGVGHLVMTGGEITENISTTTEKADITPATGDNKGLIQITGGTVSEYVANTYVGNDACTTPGDKEGTVKICNGGKHEWKGATCTAPETCNICSATRGKLSDHKWEQVAEELSTCTQAGHSSYQQCSVCGNTEGKNAYDLAEHTRSGGQTIAPTCTEAGYTEAVTCSECGTELAPRQEGDPANGHTWGDWGEPVDGIKTRTCEVCGAEDQETVSQPPVNPDPVEPEPTEPDGGNTPTEPTEPTEPDGGNTPTEPTEPDGGNTPTEPTEPDDGNTPTEPTEPDDGNTPDVPVLPETPELPDDGPDVPDDVVTIPDEDVPLGGEPAAAPVTIADEAVPLAGLLSVAQLLDELYRHEDRPAVVLPEGFPFASHEYAPAIYWALDSTLVVNTEAEPLDPDELLTVGLLRKVLTNYALFKGQEDFVVELTGEDDDLVLDLGERLTVFYAQLEAAE